MQQVNKDSVALQENGIDAGIRQAKDRLARVINSQHRVNVDLADILLKIEDRDPEMTSIEVWNVESVATVDVAVDFS